MISTVPAAPAGATAAIFDPLFTTYEVAAVPPNVTDVAPEKPLPLIVTLVPPAVGPETGLMLVIAGAFLYW
jgi:hypothetical protein